MQKHKKLLLCILDGWGYSHKKDFNAIYSANTPCMDYLLANFPASKIKTCGESVGLPPLQMGNSEVGHMTIGAGRVIPQDLLRVNSMIKDCTLLKTNSTVKNLIMKTSNKICHVLGMISDGGVHSHIEHIINFTKFLNDNNIKVRLHAFTDGRDTSPKKAQEYIRELIKNNIEIASISGRYYAMDRDNRWDRTKLSYDAITFSSDRCFEDPNDYIEKSYNKGITDEFIIPAYNKYSDKIEDGDSLLFLNFRADRIRQITESLISKNFNHFETKNLDFAYVASLVEYSSELKKTMDAIVSPMQIKNDLGEYLSNNNLKQLRIAETEKYAHVTYFFNCGRESKLNGEEWLLVPSPKVKTYDLKPEMSAYEITDKLIASIMSNKFDFLCVNYANADMVGHTGNMDASIIACSIIDKCIEKLLKVCREYNIELLITADHGNAEEMMEKNSGQVKTSHTLNDVPLIYFGNKKIELQNGELSDIAPTILDLLEIPKPVEMSGKSLMKLVGN